jgi:hypothetical protein
MAFGAWLDWSLGYLNARGHSLALAWFGCLAFILMIVGLDLLITCMIPLKFPLLQFVPICNRGKVIHTINVNE